MKIDFQELVKEFITAGKGPMLPRIPTKENLSTGRVIQPNNESISLREYLLNRLNWLAEELEELEKAIMLNDPIEIADALADILYITFGTGVTLNIPLDIVFMEVHTSNMAKFSPCPSCRSTGCVTDKEGIIHLCPSCNGTTLVAIYRESDQKLQKPEGWLPPDIKGILAAVTALQDEEHENFQAQKEG